jgi:hypothetical protein
MSTLPRYFSALVRAAFTDDELAEINETNAASPNMGCATHDYMDANALMYGAWAALYFEPPDVSQEHVCEKINAAWDEAREAGFQL